MKFWAPAIWIFLLFLFQLSDVIGQSGDGAVHVNAETETLSRCSPGFTWVRGTCRMQGLGSPGK